MSNIEFACTRLRCVQALNFSHRLLKSQHEIGLDITGEALKEVHLRRSVISKDPGHFGSVDGRALDTAALVLPSYKGA